MKTNQFLTMLVGTVLLLTAITGCSTPRLMGGGDTAEEAEEEAASSAVAELSQTNITPVTLAYHVFTTNVLTGAITTNVVALTADNLLDPIQRRTLQQSGSLLMELLMRQRAVENGREVVAKSIEAISDLEGMARKNNLSKEDLEFLIEQNAPSLARPKTAEATKLVPLAKVGTQNGIIGFAPAPRPVPPPQSVQQQRQTSGPSYGRLRSGAPVLLPNRR